MEQIILETIEYYGGVLVIILLGIFVNLFGLTWYLMKRFK